MLQGVDGLNLGVRGALPRLQAEPPPGDQGELSPLKAPVVALMRSHWGWGIVTPSAIRKL